MCTLHQTLPIDSCCSWRKACLRPSLPPRELGSTDSCIKDRAAEGKCECRTSCRQSEVLAFNGVGRWYLASLMLWREHLFWGWAEAQRCYSLMDEWLLHAGTSLTSWSCLNAWTGYEGDPGGLMSAAGSSTVSGLNERITGHLFSVYVWVIRWRESSPFFSVFIFSFFQNVCLVGLFNCLSAAVNLRSSRWSHICLVKVLSVTPAGCVLLLLWENPPVLHALDYRHCYLLFLVIPDVSHRDDPIFSTSIGPILAKVTGSDIREGKMYNLIRFISLTINTYLNHAWHAVKRDASTIQISIMCGVSNLKCN